MKLPVIRVAGNERWDCQGCGVCCRGSIIRLSVEDLGKIREQRWDDQPEFAGQRLLVRDTRAESRQRLARRADGSCVFLTEEGRCRIHEKFGAEAKPLTCRIFPLQLIPREKDTVLTLRRACPTAAVDEGRPLAEHLPEIKHLVASGALTIAAPRQAASQQAFWHHANRVLAAIARILGDERYPPVRRVMHALLYGKMLARPKLAGIHDGEFADLIALVEPTVMEETQAYFANRRPPSRFGQLLFRLTVAEYVRLHPDYQPPQGLLRRGKLWGFTWKLARGRGPLPALRPAFPDTTFAAIDQPLGVLHPSLLSPEIQRPLERYLVTSAGSYQYALVQRSGWSMLQSIRALAIRFPVALFLLRWISAGREPTVRDVAKIVVALDRGQGYRSLSNANHRAVLSLLDSQGDLQRLVAWYAR